MAWCPVCKNEYRPGIKVCVDCGAELVEELDDNPMTGLMVGEEELLNRVKEFLASNGVQYGQIEFDEKIGIYRLDVPKSDLEKSTKLADFFVQESRERMQKKALENATPEQLEQLKQESAKAMAAQRKNTVYESSAKKAEENRASAFSLISVGGIGIILILLCFFDVIPIPRNLRGSVLFFGIMGVMCLLFVVLGIMSLLHAKTFQKDMESENSLKESLETWCRENLKGDEIDRYIRMHHVDASGETLYFPRVELIKARINHQFLNLDQDFLDQFIDNTVYEMVFPEEKDNS